MLLYNDFYGLLRMADESIAPNQWEAAGGVRFGTFIDTLGHRVAIRLEDVKVSP